MGCSYDCSDGQQHSWLDADSACIRDVRGTAPSRRPSARGSYGPVSLRSNSSQRYAKLGRMHHPVQHGSHTLHCNVAVLNVGAWCWRTSGTASRWRGDLGGSDGNQARVRLPGWLRIQRYTTTLGMGCTFTRVVKMNNPSLSACTLALAPLAIFFFNANTFRSSFTL